MTPSRALLTLSVALCFAACAATDAPAAGSGPLMRSHILLDGELVDGATSGSGIHALPTEELAGHELITTPRWPRRYHEDGLRTADFIVPAGHGCSANIQATVSANVVRGAAPAAAATLVDDELRYRRALLGIGPRPGGAWGVAELHATRTQLLPTHPRARRVQAVAVFAIAARRQLHVDVLADFTGTCSDAIVRGGPIAKALAALVHGTRFAGRIVPHHLVSGQTTTFQVKSLYVGGTGADAPRARGTVSFITADSWQRTHLTSQSAKFTVPVGEGCWAGVRVTYSAQASHQDPLAQVRATPLDVLAGIVDGRRPGGAFLVMEPKLAGGPRGLDAVDAVRIAPGRWFRLRATAALNGTCTDPQVTDGYVALGLTEIVMNAAIDVRGATQRYVRSRKRVSSAAG